MSTIDFDLTAPGPIADRSYRRYDGPLHSRTLRWWTIARMMLRLALSNTAFKVVTAISFLPYVFVMLIMYLSNTFPQGGRGFLGLVDNTVGQRFAFQFYNAQGYQLLYVIIVAMIVGAGSIAADNRSNALMIYLAKPITKGDYIIGKWVGLFLTLFLMMLIPGLLLYTYCLLAYYSDGFIHNEPYLILRAIGSAAMAAAVFTSLTIGISAWSRTPRNAAAAIAALYFGSQSVAFILWTASSKHRTDSDLTLHSSVGGLVSGLSQQIYHMTIHLQRWNRRHMTMSNVDILPPSLAPLLTAALVIVVGGIIVARAKIRAVEVIRG